MTSVNAEAEISSRRGGCYRMTSEQMENTHDQ